MNGQRVLDHHDEPFVIDNHPLGVDVGPRHEKLVKADGTAWIRPDSLLTRIAAFRKESGNVEGVNVEASDLYKKEPIVIEIAGLLGLSLHLVWKADTLRIEPVGFSLIQKGHRLVPDGKPLRIGAVGWVDTDGNEHRLEGTKTHDAFVIGLVK
jgi:hypothetical protein